MKHLTLLPLFASALLWAAPVNAHNTGYSHNDEQSQNIRTLPVTASATVTLDPDMVVISAGTVTEGKDAQKTAADNAEKMSGVFQALRTAGIPQSDIKTSQLTLQPKYVYDKLSSESKIEGYTARNTLKITSYDLNTVPNVVTALINAGANNVTSIVFSVRDSEAAEASVLDEAIKKARAKARAMATSAGVQLGPLQELTVGGGGYSPYYSGGADEIVVTARSSKAPNVVTPISQGEHVIKATVTLVYEMR